MAKILIVDYNRFISQVLKKTIEKGEHQVMLAAEPGVSIISSGFVAGMDLILIDQRGADSHGWDLFNEWKQAENCPALMLYVMDDCGMKSIAWFEKAVCQALSELKNRLPLQISG
ncbi:MAG: hypothetical protein V2B19_10690 [Pseudomonadota bacterium]